MENEIIKKTLKSEKKNRNIHIIRKSIKKNIFLNKFSNLDFAIAEFKFNKNDDCQCGILISFTSSLLFT